MPEYRHDARPNHSLRFRNDTWHDVMDRAQRERTSPNPFIEEATEARLDIARCYRCRRAVPVGLGDLTGMTFSEAVRAALEAVAGQKCRAHKPVTISNNGAAAADDDLTAGLADLRTQVGEIRERMSPSVTPGGIPFRTAEVKR